MRDEWSRMTAEELEVLRNKQDSSIDMTPQDTCALLDFIEQDILPVLHMQQPSRGVPREGSPDDLTRKLIAIIENKTT